MPTSLAIVIPAYKSKYFDEALQSLVNQTNQNFKVYVGDDHSPENLLEVVNQYKHLLDITYHRFDENIGAKNLVNQWSRCLRLSKDEPWICLFSDDDVLEPNCIEQFYLTQLTKSSYEVFRFNTITINAEGKVVTHNPVSPPEESSEEMAYYLLQGKRGNVIGDHIFSRDVYSRSGGMVFTNFAQGADWATSILFSKDKGICIIPGANFQWRYSGSNISSTAYKLRNETMNGHLQFITWVIAHFKYLENKHSSISYKMIKDAARANVKQVIIGHYRGYNLSFATKLIMFYHRVLKMSLLGSIKEAFAIKRETSAQLKKLRIRISRYKKNVVLR